MLPSLSGSGLLRSSNTSNSCLLRLAPQAAVLAIIKVFKSEAKSMVGAAYARDVPNMTDAVGLVKPKGCGTSCQSRSNYEQRCAARREQNLLERVESALDCADVLHSKGKLFESLQEDAVAQTAVEEWN
eukprot:3218282-Amphidinium_carterae.1